MRGTLMEYKFGDIICYKYSNNRTGYGMVHYCIIGKLGIFDFILKGFINLEKSEVKPANIKIFKTLYPGVIEKINLIKKISVDYMSDGKLICNANIAPFISLNDFPSLIEKDVITAHDVKLDKIFDRVKDKDVYFS